ncbi:MAG: sensor histidine kinase, partial [Halobacteriaceae archaeon]
EEVVTQLGEIVGLAMARHEYEAELERERERLEFVNRLMRHNLLNSLNVVDARIGIIEEFTSEEADPHLDTIESRTSEMIDLIEKLRVLMNKLVESEELELQAVDLSTVLHEEIERARQAFDAARFEVSGDIDAAGEVLADDLLEEVIENILWNAVQHNDKDVPRVWIDVTRGEEVTTVRVADNGPGVPDDLKESIFQEGQKGIKSPGTGFGLYFVREIIDAYGGTVEVTDNDPEGAIFSISIPRV